MGATEVNFVVIEPAADPKTNALSYVIECVAFERDTMNRRVPDRRFIGPFGSFTAAHEWMTLVGSKLNDSCVIHRLSAPSLTPKPTVVTFPPQGE